MKKLNNSLDSLFKYLPLRIGKAVNSLPQEVFATANEIRLRKNAPLSVTVGNKNILFDENGIPCDVRRAIRTTENEMTECLSKLTGGSLYTCDEFITSGFIPLAEGGRAGVCGRANLKDGKTKGFAEIYSINLRIHRFLPNVARDLVSEFAENGLSGTLVCSPPALGKTTFLRSVAHLLSVGKGIDCKRVGIADERCEISVGLCEKGLLEIITGAPKSEAITVLTRTMSPEIIICDEISAEDVEQVIEAQNTGVPLVASAHCKTPNDLLKRGKMKNLLEIGAFPLCAVLSYDEGYKCEIRRTEDFL